jgi:hypothetical protein
MTVNHVSGFNISSIFRDLKPCFIWDPMHMKIGNGIAKDGTSRVEFSLSTNDTVTTDYVGAWSSSNERFEYTTEATDETKVLGSVGDFTEGYTYNYMLNDWSDTTLGFSVVSPTTSGQLSQLGTTPDIVSGVTHGNTTYVDTDSEAQAVVIEQTGSRSGTYNRVFQVLVKSVDGNNPSSSGVELGDNTSSGTRTTSSDTVWRALPGTRGWYCGYLQVPPSGSSCYISMSFPIDTGRWYIAAPMIYASWSSMQYILRAPVNDGQQRGDYIVGTANSDFAIPYSGWLAMSIIMPERSVSNGHLDYDGVAGFSTYGELFNWESGVQRIRVMMSTTYNNLVIQQDDNTDNHAYHHFGDDWVDWEAIGFVLTWNKRDSSNYSYLYVNGKKIDTEFDPATWYPTGLSASNLYIGSDGASLGFADTWIPRCAIGRRPLHKATARMLSLKMRDYATGRGGVKGDMS